MWPANPPQLMPTTMTDGRCLLVAPELLPITGESIHRCALVPERLSVAEMIGSDGCPCNSQNRPIAVIIDGRASPGTSERQLQQLISRAGSAEVAVVAVVDDLSSDISTAILGQGGHVVTPAEIESGRFGLLLRQLATAPGHLAASVQQPRPSVDCSPLAAMSDKTEVVQSLNHFAVELMNRVELPSLLQHIASETGSLTSADYAYVALVHETGEHLETVATSTDLAGLKSVRHKCGEGIGGQAWITGSTVCVSDYQSYPHRLPGLNNARQACSVPLKLGDEVVGIIGIMYESDDRNIEEQVELLEMFAPIASVAIENAKLHENTRTELARTQATSELCRAIYGSASFDRIIDEICITMIDAFDSSKVHIYKLEENNVFTPMAAWENTPDGNVRTVQSGSVTVATSVASWCIKHQQTGFIKRGVNDERESAEVHRVRAAWRLGSTLCVPLVHENKSWGVLFAHRSIDCSDFTVSERHYFELICAQISMALMRRELMEKVKYQAFHDSLTGLTNRNGFEGKLEESVKGNAGKADWFAVLFIDLDGFKNVNDSHGHTVGDKLLQQVAVMITSQLGAGDTLARMGGDEYAAIISTRTKRYDVLRIAQRINDSFSTRVSIGELQLDIGASIGVSFYPDDASSAEEVMKNADFAMYHAKGAEQGSVCVFNKWHLEVHEKRIRLESDLARAIESGEFQLHYQPKVHCYSGLVEGVEALIRWEHPTLGFIPPTEFIPVAENCGLIEVIGSWVIDEACRQIAELRRQGFKFSVAVNISARQFIVHNFVANVFGVIAKYNLPASAVQLEVTESVVMNDIEMVVKKLALLRNRGIKIAIDDFGTGYSSLQYLAELPLDILKIDKSFVDKLGSEPDEQLLVKTIVMMSGELDLETVAEGVETHFQRQKLESLGCDYIQGYYYSKPVPARELIAAVQRINQRGLSPQAA
ncbi:hypothetical protein AB833_13180 [Chromatiales bacterium (ex Bugula neritina AB1)]|nr:hypothetical protein AB833_13180 [Chromatiales bacterium (ex Bugula neritina AB1)]